VAGECRDAELDCLLDVGVAKALAIFASGEITLAQ
jgi:hypothetical protein